MSFNVFPTELTEEAFSDWKIKKVVNKNFTINRVALKGIVALGIFEQKQAEEVALKVIKQYKKKYKALKAEGLSNKEALSETFNEKKLLVQRVRSLANGQIAQGIREKFRGMKYQWLPSEAIDPRPLHQLKYGRFYRIGDGVLPGEEPNCQCGMRIITPETEFNLFYTKEII